MKRMGALIKRLVSKETLWEAVHSKEASEDARALSEEEDRVLGRAGASSTKAQVPRASRSLL